MFIVVNHVINIHVHVSHRPGVRTGSFHTKEFLLRAPLRQWCRSHDLHTVCPAGSYVVIPFGCFLVSVNSTVLSLINRRSRTKFGV